MVAGGATGERGLAVPACRIFACHSVEVHDPDVLAGRATCSTARPTREMQQAVIAAVARNARWRGDECINLLAPEAPISPTVRALLAAEVGTARRRGPHRPGQPLVRRHPPHRRDRGAVRRAAEAGLPRPLRRPPAGGQHDRQHGRLHRADPAGRRDHERRPALRRPLQQPADGPAGVRGLQIVDVPMDPVELEVDLDAFAQRARARCGRRWSRSGRR